jgi:glycosyltransferase involved in cell wall biosynthesis
MSDTDHLDGTVPALSIVMPAYNVERFIDRAIDSVLAQTFSDFELVIVDDVSSDRTWDIIQERAALDTRIKPFRNVTNGGVGPTINRGIELSTAPLIGRLDADDMATPDRFEKQIALLEANPHFAVVGTFASHINENDDVLSLSPTGPASEAEFEELRSRGEPTMVFGGSALFTRELFDKAGGFDPALVNAEDLDLFDRMSDYGPIVAVPEPLLLYRLHGNSNVRRTFFEGRQIHRFVHSRREARHRGAEPPLSYEEFKRWESNLPIWTRAGIWLEDRAQLRYREAGMAYGNGDKLGFAWNLLRAFLANPPWVVKRLWNQRLSPEARSRRPE